ncbi:hypothetical protein M501DRAFT_1001162 [Patellaria atrata CBS 101060]|uniref:Protein-lysine N-methyltransferase EFM4 n=1 Tax=Patellaria atrata CBS 101060 TaxID=1346257 RepID=A0A9P4VLU9_9PEZI|nr:hypothetical protein M501DRAFT_1001162 [Patellaria atrata CBS 101060]
MAESRPTRDPSHLDPSELGTKEYWESAYTLELENNATDHTDVGTIWFSDASAEEKIIDFINDLRDEELIDPDRCSFIDVGTGNGHLLWEIWETGFRGRMLGVDYSAASVALARRIREHKALAVDEELTSGEEPGPDISFEEWDVLNQEPGNWMSKGGFDIVLDKGTFDAISLSADVDGLGRRICENYSSKVEKLAKVGGLVIVTSCNWTEEELRHWFDGGELSFWRKIKYPSFQFGGNEGSKVCTLCFKRK